MLGCRFESVVHTAASRGKASILRVLVRESTPVEQLYPAAVSAVRNEQAGVVSLMFQWSKKREELREILKATTALLSHYNTCPIYYNAGETQQRLRGTLRALGLGLLPEANALAKDAWARVFEGVEWNWCGESTDAEVQRQLLAFFCSGEMRVALRAALTACDIGDTASGCLVPHLPCRTVASLSMMEDLCGYSGCSRLDVDPETAQRIVEFAAKHGAIQGALRLSHTVSEEQMAMLVATAMSERNIQCMNVYQMTNPASVEAALLVHEEPENLRDSFHTWLLQRRPGFRWSPPVFS